MKEWRYRFEPTGKIKLPFLKVSVTVILGIKLVIKLPFISESYRFAFLRIMTGNFDMDKVTVFS